jgi:integrase
MVTKDMLERALVRCPTKSKQSRDKFLLALLYLTGARPFEVTLLKRKDFYELPEAPGFLNIRLWNAKLGSRTDYKVRHRVLVLDEKSSFMKELFTYLNKFTDPEARVFPWSTDLIEYIVWKASEYEVCPYTFRHSALGRLAMEPDVGLTQLMAWKGAKDVNSVSSYIANKPNLPRKIV